MFASAPWLVFLYLYVSSSHALGISSSSNSSSSTALIASPRDGGWGWGWNSGGSSLHSFFDIALTALAFMSFGIFLLNLLLNALLLQPLQTGLTDDGPIVTMIDTGDMTMTGATEAPAGLIEGYRLRKKRSTKKIYYVDSLTAANTLAETVLKSIDSMIEKHECLPTILCDGNRKAQLVGHGFQYLMPIYSFSSSYIGRKFGFHDNIPEHVDAILDGVTENCPSHFPKMKDC